MEKFAHRLKELRDYYGMTQAEVEYYCDVMDDNDNIVYFLNEMYSA